MYNQNYLLPQSFKIRNKPFENWPKLCKKREKQPFRKYVEKASVLKLYLDSFKAFTLSKKQRNIQAWLKIYHRSLEHALWFLLKRMERNVDHYERGCKLVALLCHRHPYAVEELRQQLFLKFKCKNIFWSKLFKNNLTCPANTHIALRLVLEELFCEPRLIKVYSTTECSNNVVQNFQSYHHTR